MVTHSSRHAIPHTDAPHGARIGARVLEWMRQTYCGLHGHDAMLHFEKERMYLQCASCGHQTAGWELTEVARPPVPARAETAPHHAVIRPRLISERRIA